MTESLYGEVGSIEYDNLVAGNNVPLLVKGVVVAAGQGVLKKGSVLGIVTATSKGLFCAAASVDGSQEAKFVLADDVDATEEVVALCYQSGELNRGALIFDSTDTAEMHEDELRKNGIFLKDIN
ncbi:MAG: head decoration protein [Tenericutes bacterium HGW-Tenericutes-1]|jgi:hypothetical protein|nr:MAG: head decoration protein [Tenericutes bacterium HGW-Tenericutes-1]PKM95800.1 MAG: head decoration protein [Firmicutes bacterium HGW-Firmicutes-1]